MEIELVAQGAIFANTDYFLVSVAKRKTETIKTGMKTTETILTTSIGLTERRLHGMALPYLTQLKKVVRGTGVYFGRGDTGLRTFAGNTSDSSKTKYCLPCRRNAAVRCSRMCGFPCRPSVPRITPKDFAPRARSIASLPGAEVQNQIKTRLQFAW